MAQRDGYGMPRCSIDTRDNRCVVRGAFQFAGRNVDDAGVTAPGQICGQQNVIDAQAEIALEAIHPIVPPAEGLRRLIEQPERIDQTQPDKTTKRIPLGYRA